MYSSEMGKVIADDIHAVELDFGCIGSPKKAEPAYCGSPFRDAL